MANHRALRIGGASAFWGDSNQGVGQLVERGEVDVLVFDYLAELTMSILASARVRDPELGYATDFVTATAPHLQAIAKRGIKLLSNAGGIHPQACARALAKAAAAAGVQLRIAVVEGDDLLPAEADLRAADVRELDTGAPLPARLTSINAYLGAAPVVAALRAGADVVITGRCADSALALAALVHHFDWSFTDYDKLAAGSLVGHILECSTQTTGGLFSDWWRVPGWDDMGYPIAACDADGSFTLTKPPGTGGLVTPLSVAEQMLYEVGDPARYLLPDVTADLTAVTLTQAGPDAVRVGGARGTAPTPHYKVSAVHPDGYRLATTLTFVGQHAAAMGQRAAEAILQRSRRLIQAAGHADFGETRIEVLGSERNFFGAHAQHAAREVVVRIAVRHPNEKALRILAGEIAPMGIMGAPGTTGFSGRPKAQAVYRLFSFLWEKARVPLCFAMEGTRHTVPLVEHTTTRTTAASAAAHQNHPTLPAGPRRTVPLSAIAVARSGDKGDNANVAVIARTPRLAALIGEQLDTARVGAWLAHLVAGPVERFEVPGVHAFNFVLRRALGGGGAASLRVDPLGKTFGQILLCHPVSVFEAWAEDIDAGPPAAVAGVAG